MPCIRLGVVRREDVSLYARKLKVLEPLGEGSIGQAGGHVVGEPRIGCVWNGEKAHRVKGRGC